MILIKDVPLVPLQQAVFKILKAGQTTAIYGDVPTKASLPYMATINVDVWADTNGKRKVNDVLNDISALLSYYGPTLPVEGYKTISASIDVVEAFPEQTTGYHGTLTASFLLNKE